MRSWPVESCRWVRKVVNLRGYEREKWCVLRRERNWLRERDSVLNGRGVGEDGVGIFWEKDLRLVGREFQRRGEAFRKERSENLSLDVSGGRERQTEVIGWSSYASGFDIDKLAKVTGLRFMKEIVGNGDYFDQMRCSILSQWSDLSAGFIRECLGVRVTVRASAFLIC